MKKIPSVFKRDYTGTRLIYNEVVPGSEWVLAGEGVATAKWDGTCCKVEGGKLYKRYDAKQGKTPPHGFIPSQDPDPVTGHWPGWLEVEPASPENRWHVEAWEREKLAKNDTWMNATYELIGPKIQGNPHGYQYHCLVQHGQPTAEVERTFEGIKAFLSAFLWEGIVFWHPDGRMAKVKRKDYGLPWPIKKPKEGVGG